MNQAQDIRLTELGFRPVATMRLTDPKTVSVEITDLTLGTNDEAVYAWVSPNECLRVGTSKAVLKGRLLAYAKDISKSLKGLKGSTPEWEGEKWKGLLEQHGKLTAICLQPDLVATAAGPIRPFLDIERVLIGKLKPTLNRGYR